MFQEKAWSVHWNGQERRNSSSLTCSCSFLIDQLLCDRMYLPTENNWDREKINSSPLTPLLSKIVREPTMKIKVYFCYYRQERWSDRVGAIISYCKSESLIRIHPGYREKDNPWKIVEMSVIGIWWQWIKESILSQMEEIWMHIVHV